MKRFVALFAVTAVLVGCSSRSQDASSDPCELLSTDQASAILDSRVTQAMPLGSGKGCSYGDRKDPQATTLLVHVLKQQSNDDFTAARALAAKSSPVQDLGGIGQTAFTTFKSSQQIATADALDNGIVVRVLIEGPGATVEKAKRALTLTVERS